MTNETKDQKKTVAYTDAEVLEIVMRHGSLDRAYLWYGQEIIRLKTELKEKKAAKEPHFVITAYRQEIGKMYILIGYLAHIKRVIFDFKDLNETDDRIFDFKYRVEPKDSDF